MRNEIGYRSVIKRFAQFIITYEENYISLLSRSQFYLVCLSLAGV